MSAPSTSPLLDALQAHANAGYLGSFSVSRDSCIRCDRCRTKVAPEIVDLHTLRRLEGVSDPDGMVAVCGLECPRCGQLGTAVIHYGPTATSEEADVLSGLQDRRPTAEDRVPQ